MHNIQSHWTPIAYQSPNDYRRHRRLVSYPLCFVPHTEPKKPLSSIHEVRANFSQYHSLVNHTLVQIDLKKFRLLLPWSLVNQNDTFPDTNSLPT